VNFDFRKGKILTVVKLGTCVVDVLCQLRVKYNMVKICIVEVNLEAKFKIHSFPDLYELFWCDVKD
jgi:hypothetical protein